MSLYFARHGQTVFNLENRFQGLSDSPLTDLGKAQARRLGEFAKQAGVTNLIVSPRGRAIETAKIVIEALGQDIPVVIDQIWREMCY
ncbi:MAG: histidine phosphatase family protein, partial [Patescibacteria group bacterium]